jgi:hypothetical protein
MIRIWRSRAALSGCPVIPSDTDARRRKRRCCGAAGARSAPARSLLPGTAHARGAFAFAWIRASGSLLQSREVAAPVGLPAPRSPLVLSPKSERDGGHRRRDRLPYATRARCIGIAHVRHAVARALLSATSRPALVVSPRPCVARKAHASLAIASTYGRPGAYGRPVPGYCFGPRAGLLLRRLMCRWHGAVNDVNERVVWLPGAIVI